MIVIFWKGKVWKWVHMLCEKLGISNALMDDQDRNDQELQICQSIVVSPGIKPSHAIYQKYPEKIISELNFIWEIINNFWLKENIKFIGVTGTDGKSTTVHVLFEAFKKILPENNIRLSWNFDIPLGQTIAHIIEKNLTNEKHLIILECSSFMLYKLRSFIFDYSIFLNISADHLDRHKDMEEYFQTKKDILEYTKIHGFTNQSIYDTLDRELQSKISVYNTFDISTTHFVGKHNACNIGASVDCIKKYFEDNEISIDSEKILETIKKILPLPHRIQPIRTINEITIYDDGKSTSSHSLKAAIQSFDEPLVLIAWGSDKGDNFDHLAWEVWKNIKYGVFLWTTASQFANIFEQQHIPHIICNTMQEVVQNAYQQAMQTNSKVILFSPWCASFDMFLNYEDRAKKFISEVEKLS